MNSNTSVYCMQFDVSDLRENELPNFTTTLQNDVSSMKPDIVYIQQTKHGVQLQELGLRMKGLGYDGYEQTITPELKQATYFRSNLLRGLYGNQETTTGWKEMWLWPHFHFHFPFCFNLDHFWSWISSEIKLQGIRGRTRRCKCNTEMTTISRV